jgi:hypothetical protein
MDVSKPKAERTCRAAALSSSRTVWCPAALRAGGGGRSGRARPALLGRGSARPPAGALGLGPTATPAAAAARAVTELVCLSWMIREDTAVDWATAQVARVRDDPARRMALLSCTYRGPLGRAPRHLPFRRAAMSFMRWQAERGVLRPLDANPHGSAWWQAVNDRLLFDGCEAMARSGGLMGERSSATIELWMSFIAVPTARSWYRAHDASIVSAYLENRDLAESESMPERFFLNVALLRVLYAHALSAAPRLAPRSRADAGLRRDRPATPSAL